MKSAVLSDVQEFSIVDRQQPSVSDDNVLINVNYVGICGSDLHYYQHGQNGDNVVDFPHILGHEAAGTIVDVGEGVESLEPGDRVAIEPGLPCGDCPKCKTPNQYHLCEEMEYMSSPPVNGALTEFVAWPKDQVYLLPDTLSLREGALIEPLSVALHAGRRADIQSDDSVLITGGGPIGLLIAQVAAYRDAKQIILTDVVSEKLAMAETLGVDLALDATAPEIIDRIHHATDGNGVDIVIESSGAGSAIKLGCDAVTRGGDVVFVGIPPNDSLPVGVIDLIDRELDIRGSFRFSNTYPEAITGLANGELDVEKIISFETELQQVKQGFERAAEPEMVKGLIHVSA